MTLLTISQAAAELNISARRLQQLCHEGRVKHEWFFGRILIAPKALEAVRVRPVGRPKKEPK